MTKVGAEENARTDCARRIRSIPAMDGGSIPPISTNRCHGVEAPRSPGSMGIAGLSFFVAKSAETRIAHIPLAHIGREACPKPLVAGFGPRAGVRDGTRRQFVHSRPMSTLSAVHDFTARDLKVRMPLVHRASDLILMFELGDRRPRRRLSSVSAHTPTALRTPSTHAPMSGPGLPQRSVPFDSASDFANAHGQPSL